MRKIGILFLVLLVFASLPAARSQVVDPLARLQPSEFVLSMEAVNAIAKVNTHPYITKMATDLKYEWLPLAAHAKVEHPLVTPVESIVAVTIASDGSLSEMKLESTAYDDLYDQAAWNALKGTKLSRPPAGLPEGVLKLRVHFVVTPSAQKQ
jgi:hypothetical protein